MRKLFLIAVLALAALVGWLFVWTSTEPAPTQGAELVPFESTRLEVAVAQEPEVVETQQQAVPELRAAPGIDWVGKNNRATALLEEGELREAVDLFEACHAGDPDNDIFRRNLVEALIRLARAEHDGLGLLSAALENLDRAILLGFDRADLAALQGLRERWGKEAELAENHWTDRSIYFELSYDADRADILHEAQYVLDHLEAVYADLRDWFRIDPVIEEGRPKIRVVLYDGQQFDRVTGLGDWAGGAFDGIVRVTVEDLSAERGNLERVLRHELVHAFVHQIGGDDVPGWLNEGVSQWLEWGPESAAMRDRRLQVSEERVRRHRTFSLDRLQGSLASWSDPNAIRTAYAQSLVITAHLATSHDYGEESLRRMIVACGRGEDPLVAFETYTRVPLSFALRGLTSGR